jgi:hypothetical protein
MPNQDLLTILDAMQRLANLDDDGDTFFCKEADFPSMIKNAITLAKEGMEIDRICIGCNQLFKLIGYDPARGDDNKEDIATFKCECGTHRIRLEVLEAIAEK